MVKMPQLHQIFSLLERFRCSLVSLVGGLISNGEESSTLSDQTSHGAARGSMSDE